MRSNHTIAELKVAALLLGPEWEYDAEDHTFTDDCDLGRSNYIDPDTMEPCYINLNHGEFPAAWAHRKMLVMHGEIGALDAK